MLNGYAKHLWLSLHADFSTALQASQLDRRRVTDVSGQPQVFFQVMEAYMMSLEGISFDITIHDNLNGTTFQHGAKRRKFTSQPGNGAVSHGNDETRGNIAQNEAEPLMARASMDATRKASTTSKTFFCAMKRRPATVSLVADRQLPRFFDVRFRSGR